MFPAGTIVPYAANATTPPLGWAKCGGGPASRTNQSILFGVIGVSYGSGDGSTTFGLPELRGRSSLGLSSGSLGDTGGHRTVSLSSFQIASHSHLSGSHTHSITAHTHSQPVHSHSIVLESFMADPASIEIYTFPQNGVNSFVLPRQNIAGTTGIAGSGTSGEFSGGDSGDASVATTGSIGGGQAHPNMPPYMAVEYLIKP